MVYLVEFHEITKILLTLREITKKITKNFQLPKKSEKSRNITKSNLNYQIWSHWEDNMSKLVITFLVTQTKGLRSKRRNFPYIFSRIVASLPTKACSFIYTPCIMKQFSNEQLRIKLQKKVVYVSHFRIFLG